MPLKIVRNDITKMNTEAIVNTANAYPTVGSGCDQAVYEAAGYEELRSYRKKYIGFAKAGDAFITPGFRLPAKYIIHAVSPLYEDGKKEEERLLRSCYRSSLSLAAQYGIRSISFPLISTGSFGYPKEEGMRIAVDEINAFLLSNEMLVFLVVFDEKATRMGRSLYPDLEAYIDRNYVLEKEQKEYRGLRRFLRRAKGISTQAESGTEKYTEKDGDRAESSKAYRREYEEADSDEAESIPSYESSLSGFQDMQYDGYGEESHLILPKAAKPDAPKAGFPASALRRETDSETAGGETAFDKLRRRLSERFRHMSDTFSEYLLYLIREKGMENSEVYKRAIVDKKVFSKIKNSPDYHPQKLTALCLCIGARLSLDESKDLLSRAGYALSPCDKTDIIFSYFIENEIYDMIELDIQLEEHGLPCIIH